MRDWSVTGVQTCALPICGVPDTLVLRLGVMGATVTTSERSAAARIASRAAAVSGAALARKAARDSLTALERAEERRVGKGETGGGGAWGVAEDRTVVSEK